MGGKHTPDQIGLRRLCTIKEIAEAADVGVGTVHRVLKGKRVGGASLLRVRKAILDLNQTAMRMASCELIERADHQTTKP
jgi:DNA-binding LacI/PurR family transcriptional regulator